ncbi:hypothetical protein [Caloramator sp. mosi_1]
MIAVTEKVAELIKDEITEIKLKNLIHLL